MLKRFKVVFLLSLLSSPALFAEQVGPFRITEVAVFAAGNMMFRVAGMGQPSSCPGQPWAYVDEADSGSKTKISTLLAAHTSKKNVYLRLHPVNFFSNGVMYCQISSITVHD